MLRRWTDVQLRRPLRAELLAEPLTHPIRNGGAQATSRHLMLVPSLACPASCSYCFGPHTGGPSLRPETVQAVARWQQALDQDDESLDITFHGGEPLVPGVDFCRMAMPLFRSGLAPRAVHFSVQSNLWLLTAELYDLFRQYEDFLDTSLDGPRGDP